SRTVTGRRSPSCTGATCRGCWCGWGGGARRRSSSTGACRTRSGRVGGRPGQGAGGGGGVWGVGGVGRPPRCAGRGGGGRRGGEGTSGEEDVVLAVQYGDLGAALASLSPELRAVVQATVLDGLTTREAAKLLGIPPGTVKTRMMRARAQLRERLA